MPWVLTISSYHIFRFKNEAVILCEGVGSAALFLPGKQDAPRKDKSSGSEKRARPSRAEACDFSVEVRMYYSSKWRNIDR